MSAADRGRFMETLFLRRRFVRYVSWRENFVKQTLLYVYRMFCLGDRNRKICDSAAGTNVKVKNNLSAEYSHHFEIYPGMQIHTIIQTSEMWWLI